MVYVEFFSVHLRYKDIMTDTMTPEQRSRCMAAVKSKDTKPELMVRKFLFARGLRYRLNNRKLPGSSDIVLRKYRTVVFVDGCFWHGHDGCRLYRLPQTNADFWRHKINLNIARDYRNNVDLRLLGWKVIRIWECSLRDSHLREASLEALYNKIVGGENTYGEADAPGITAAEPIVKYGK